MHLSGVDNVQSCASKTSCCTPNATSFAHVFFLEADSSNPCWFKK